MTVANADTLDTAHDAFVIEREYAASPAQVFAAWADPAAKARWFANDAWGRPEHALDFRVGGRETNRTGPAGGPVHLYDACYQDIVPNRRIVLAYAMSIGGLRISASLLTVELRPADEGTRLRLTEQIATFDPRYGVRDRKAGTEALLQNLAASLAGERR